jgi:hypothetical protein
VRRPGPFALSVPERIVRAVAAALGGTLHETAELVLPRLVRRSRLYEATARNLLRITVEVVGGVERDSEEVVDEFERSAKKLAVRRRGATLSSSARSSRSGSRRCGSSPERPM